MDFRIFQDLDELVFRKWTMVVFRDMDWTIGSGWLGFLRIKWTKETGFYLGFSGSGLLELDSVVFFRILALIVM